MQEKNVPASIVGQVQIFTKLGFKPAVVRSARRRGNETVIRTAYPVPQVKQLRLRLELATRRTRCAFDRRHRSLRGDDSAHADDLQSRYDDLRKRIAAYHLFETRFDKFVGLLCVAAQEGVTPEREAAFKEQRTWFVAQYPTFRPYLAPFLTPDPADHAPGWWRQRSCDAFEALFLPLCLAAMLEDKNLISRLTRAQNAVNGWYKSLRVGVGY